MVKAYLRYAPEAVLAVVASPATVVGASTGGFASGHSMALVPSELAESAERGAGDGDDRRLLRRRPRSSHAPALGAPPPLVVVAAVEAVNVWDLQRGALVARFHDEYVRAQVTCVAVSSSSSSSSSSSRRTVAAGYADGRIRTFDLDAVLAHGAGRDSALPRSLSAVACVPSVATLSTYQGHRAGVTTLQYSDDGALLLSGSRDGDLILWDTLSNQGLFRLRGAHRDRITDARFIDGSDGKLAVSCSKDGYVKVWALDTQHCVQVLVGHRGEVLCLATLQGGRLLVTGSTDQELRVWRRRMHGAHRDDGEKEADIDAVYEYIGAVRRQSASRMTGIAVHGGVGDEQLMACYGADRVVEVYQVRDEDDAERHRKRRRRRIKEKQAKKQQQQQQPSQDGDAADEATQAVAAADFLHLMLPLRAPTKVVGMQITLPPLPPAQCVGARDLVLHLANNCIEVQRIVVPALGARRKRGAKERAAENGLFADEDDNGDNAWRVAADNGAEGHEAAERTQPRPTVERVFAIEVPGHRDEIRALALPDDALYNLAGGAGARIAAMDVPTLLSVSGVAKVWNIASGQCLRTVPLSGAGACAALLAPPPSADVSFPHGKYAVVGTREGHLDLVDCHGGAVLFSVAQAHGGGGGNAVSAVAQSPGGGAVVSGGADKCVRFWRLYFPGGPTAVALKLERTLELSSDVLAMRFTPNARYLIVSLLDATVRAFHTDTLRFHLSFYGHKLPVTSLDVSDDSRLLVTASADKSCKVWGLEFGDCHRSFGRAHEDGVACVRFQPGGTHYFWSAGRDGSIRYWDADVGGDNALISSLEGTQWGHRSGRVTALAVGAGGELLVSAGSDGAIRLWRRTDEQLFAGDERESRLDALFDEAAVREPERHPGALAERDDDEQPADGDDSEARDGGEAGVATLVATEPAARRTLDSVTATDRIVEALADVDEALAFGDRARLYHGDSPAAHVYEVLRRVRAPDLEAALIALPFSAAARVLRFCHAWLRAAAAAVVAAVEEGIQREHERGSRVDTELVIRAALILMQQHFHAVARSGGGGGGGGADALIDRRVVEELRDAARSCANAKRDTLGFNLAGLRYVQRELKARDDAPFRDATRRTRRRGGGGTARQ